MCACVLIIIYYKYVYTTIVCLLAVAIVDANVILNKK